MPSMTSTEMSAVSDPNKAVIGYCERQRRHGVGTELGVNYIEEGLVGEFLLGEAACGGGEVVIANKRK